MTAATATPVPAARRDLPGLFRAQVERTPDAVAVVARGRAVGFAELARRAGRIAEALRRAGIGSEDRVGVFLSRSATLPAALLGILEAGAGYVPLDPAYPAERVAYMAKDAGVRVLVTETDLAGRLPEGLAGRATLLADRVERGEAELVPRRRPCRPAEPGIESGLDPGLAPGPARLAYVIYTSGSTGAPKGVGITHANAAAFLEWARREIRPDERRGLLCTTSVCFDVSIFEIFLPLCWGGTLLLVDSEFELLTLRTAPPVTMISTVPSVAAELLRQAPLPASVRTVCLAGEALPRSVADALYAQPNVERVLNLYGPTEDTTYSTWAQAERTSTEPPSIGVALSGGSAHVADARLEALPDGEVGELYLGGAGVARGYLGRPDLTAERFVPDPFAGAAAGGPSGGPAGGRLYRTGDRVRREADGRLSFLGRLDHQVKIHGLRIELGEVEAVLDRIPEVGTGVVLARERAPGDLRLVAYVVPRSPGAARPEALREAMQRSLPEYMVPQHFVVLDAFPKTPSGKVDRRALPEPRYEGPAGGALRTPVETRLAALWTELLGVEGIGPADDFFGLGGHSLLAARMLFRVRESLGAQVSLAAFLGERTLERLAALVEREAGSPGAAPGALDPGELARVAAARAAETASEAPRERPLSLAQRRLWLLERMEPGTPLYNVAWSERIEGPVDAAALAAALSQVAARHEPLRTTFAERGDRPVQVVSLPLPVPLPLVDLAALPAKVRTAEADRVEAGLARRPFELTRGPLLRAALVRLGPGGPQRLLVVVHHAVFDGWSVRLFADELAEGYRARREGRGAALPPLPVRYGDFASWQHRWLGGGALEAEIEHWRRALAGAPVTLELPADRPRPPVRSRRGALATAELPVATIAAARALALHEGATPFIALFAAFAALLGRWSAQDDLLVGTPSAGRPLPELARLIGFFVNTLVLRADLAGDPPFRTLLGRVRERALAAYAHEALPFERLVEALRPERDRSRSPLVQVVFSLDEDAAGGGLGTCVEIHTGTAKFDLLVELRVRPDGVQVAAEYPADLFDAATIERLLAGYARLLEGALAAPDRRLSELPLLGPEERHQVLAEWSRRPGPAVPETTVAEAFAGVAERAPEAVALVSGGGHLSYGALTRRAGRLAGELRRLGIGPETPVALALERSADLVTAILGVLGAGGCYLPLDPSFPEERLAFVLEDVAAPVVVTTAARASRLPPGAAGSRLLLLERFDPGGGEAAFAPPPVGPEAAAYVMYTSGSTGRPKGVVVPQRAVIRLALQSSFARFGPDETFLQLAPAAFDAATLELWGALLHGGRLVVAPAGPQSPAELGRAVAAERVTTLWLTAGLFHQVAEAGLEDFGGLRRLLAGGDVLSPEHCRRTLRALPETVLVNGYGPTENTTFTCTHEMATPEAVTSPVPLGRPIEHGAVYVVDRWLRPVPPGVPGELVAGGEGLARGYAGRPALTAERFVPDPFAPAAGARLYRTGDRVRWLAGGEVELLGRLDQQVKIRGFRVEPGEIEAALAAHPAVAEAVVAARPDPAGGRRLVAYVVPAEAAGEPSPAASLPGTLRTHLAARLPDPMVPAAVVLLAALPLGPTGKVDRAALPEPTWEAEAASAAAEPPAGAVEEVVAALWTEVLALEPGSVGRHARFFDLGGHSLAAARVVARMRDALGVEVPLAALFDCPTVAGLAERAEAALAAGGSALPPLPRLERAPRDPTPGAPPPTFPLSFSQERLWFLDRYEPGTALYNVPMAFALSGRLDVRALAASLRELVRRHEVLRTTYATFAEAPAGARQVVRPEARLPLPLVDLSPLPAPQRERAAAAEAARFAREPFDLACGPVVRAELLRLGERDHRLLLGMHHVATDGWSLEVLQDELAELYPAFAAGAPSPLPEPPVQFADFAVWQRAWLGGELLAAQAAYWREHLAGLEPLELPADRPRPAVQSTRGAVRSAPLPASAVAAAEAVGRGAGATPYMTLLAVFAALVARLSGRTDLAFGTPMANRRSAELDRVVGFFVNTLVLRVDLSGAPSFRKLVARVRQASLGAYLHQDLPFERLVDALGVERDLARTPLFQLFFSYLAERPPRALGEVEVAPLPIDGGTAKFDLSWFVNASAGRAEASAEYAADLFDATTVERLLRAYAALLAAAAAEPDRPLAALPLLGPAERQHLLVEWAEVPGPPPPPACLHELFVAQAARTPDAEALIAGTERLTYRELDERSARLARHLLSLGVGPESRVAVAAGRGARLVVALLAVLRAGGAYVPLDPAYPRRRLEWMLEDSGAAVVLTEAGLAPDLPAPPEQGARTVLLDRLGELGRLDGPDAPARALPGNLAYLIYTSGSTGRPKAVAITHANAAALVHWARRTFDDEELSGVAAATSISFDLSVFELFVPLACGGRVILAEDALAVPDLPAAGEVTLIDTVPSAMEALVRAGRVPPSVRTVNLAGEPLSRELAERVSALPGVRRLLDLYGPSEDTTYSTAGAWSPPGPSGSGAPTIGRPVLGTRAWVVDAALAPLPLGVPGELVLGGAGVTRGYLGRPGLTAERYVPDPFSRAPGERLYRTGDLARHLADGRLDFLGRIDHQVKIRGFRIEPREVESVLARHPAVAEAAVVPRADAELGLRLVAYVAGAGGEPPIDELRRHLEERLPAHMVPAAWVALAALPRTPNGKLDRAALPEPESAAASGGRDGAPRTPVEEALADLWTEVLGLKRGSVGIHDGFFALGGHSLVATRLLARVREVLGVEVPLRALFQAPTVAALAEHVEQALAAGAAPAAALEAPPPLVPAPRTGPLPLSFNQEQLWFVDQLEPGDPSVNAPFALRLAGDLRLAALARALSGCVARHEVLRTTFSVEAGRPRQLVAPPSPLPLPIADLSGLPATRREPEARRLAAADGRRPFDLARGPICRARLLRLEPVAHVLLWSAHHVAYDGWSHRLLLGELEALYRGAIDRRPAGLPELQIQYADYAAWQREWLRGEVLERRLAYWRERLGGELPTLALPWDRARPRRRPGRERRGELSSRLLSGAPLEGLRTLAREAGATLFMVLLAVFDVLLHRYSGATDLVVGTPVANRGRGEVAGLIGFFVNTLALRSDLSGDPALRELVARARETCLAAYAHAEVPFAAVVAAAHPERAAGAPLFRVMLALEVERPGAGGERFADLEVAPFDFHNGTCQFDLTLYAFDRGTELELVAEYDAELFGAGGGELVLRDLEAMIGRAVAEPGARLSDLATLPVEALPASAGPEPAPVAPPSPALRPAAAPASAGCADAADRRERLAERRARLGADRRAELERRLRGGAQAAASDAPRCLVPLRPGGGAPPLFLVHPAGGDVLCFRALAGHLAPGRPVYGLQSRGLAPGAPPDASFDAMTGHYLEEMRRAHPSGPYHLAGWSLGGGLAFELACRLEAEAEAPGLVAVLDTVPSLSDLDLPELDPDATPDDARWLMHVVDYAEGLSGRPLGIAYEDLAALAPPAQLTRVAGALGGAGLLPAGAEETYLGRLLEVFKTNCRAAADYRPGVYGGAVVLLRAADSAPVEPAADLPDLGWGRHARGGVAVETVPGSHVTLLAEPAVRVLAARLDARLAQHEGVLCPVIEEVS